MAAEYPYVNGNYKCRFSVNKNANVYAYLISDPIAIGLQRNKVLKNVFCGE